jgi:ribosomal protein S9
LTLSERRVYDGKRFNWGTTMAKKSKLTQVAVKIGGAIGKADRTAHKVAKAGVLAKKELEDISKQVDALKRQLQKTTKRLRHALR